MRSAKATTEFTHSNRDLFGWYAGALFALMLVALGVLIFAGTMPAGLEFSIDRATFAVVNAITLTGFQMSIASLDQYQPVGQVLICSLTFISTILWLCAGGSAAVRILRIPVGDLAVFLHALAWTGALTLLGAIVLSLGERTSFQALFLAVSSFSNSGLAMGNLPGSTHWQLWIVILPLAQLGGLGMPVLIELWLRFSRRRMLSTYSTTVLWLLAVTFLLGTGVQLLIHALSGAVDMTALVSSAVNSVNSRSLGLPVDTPMYSVRALRWVTMGLMLVGAGGASCAGGLKVTTVLELVRGVRSSLSGESISPVFGVACVSLVSLVLIVGVCFFALLTTQPQLSSDRLLFLSISAATGAGMSQDPVSIVGSGLFVLSNTMLLGKLVPLMILWWMVTKTPRASTLVA